MNDFLFNKNIYGVAYYPELWDIGEIDKDISRFIDLGITTVRIGEFAWSYFQPAEDTYRFDVFDCALDKLHAAGIAVVFCTPSVTPPRWFTVKYPHSVWVDCNGKAMSHGSREHVCEANEDYIRCSVQIAEKLAERYKDHPAIVAWQIHNEINWPQRECFCESCAKKWAQWLKNKYKTVDALNKAWGNGIWSMDYPSFETVVRPFPTPYLHNTAMLTDYTRFTYENAANFIGYQAQAIKKYTQKPVTTNLNRIFYLNFSQIAEKVDFVSLDDYSEQTGFEEQTLQFDLFRNLKKDVPFVFMETSPSHGGCVMGTSKYHEPGFLTAELACSLFAGSAGMSYWVWRQQRAGCEQLHGHILQAWGAPSLAYPRVQNTGKHFSLISKVLRGAKNKVASVALLYSDDARTYFMHESFGQVDYYRDILSSYKAILKTGATVDVVPETRDLSEYPLIYVPLMPYVSETLADKLYDAAKKGATVIFGSYTGWRTEYHTLHVDHALGKLEEKFSIKVCHLAQLASTDAHVVWQDKKYALTGHTAVYADGNGTICGGSADGGFAVCERQIGKGNAVFVGGMFGCDFEEDLLRHFARKNKIPQMDKEYGIMHYELVQDKKQFLCVVNMTAQKKKIVLHDSRFNVLTGEQEQGEIVLQSCEYKIFR